MARHNDDLTEEEARQAMSRRHQPDDRSPGERSSWLDQFGYGPAPMFGGFGWPFLPPAYGDDLYGYGPYRRPGPMRRRGAPPGDIGERDFMDRAGDEIRQHLGRDPRAE